ncbi:MAG: glycosyltransferase family 9 protein [Verrucomicrobia bacterium]|nr:glycosyltransferase family 9 protein [Verrucomicrobiota bacterium]
MISETNKILVIRGGAIGDFILTLPVLSALRAHFPTSRLAVLGYPRIASMAQAGGLADEIRSIEERPLAQFFARNGSLDPGFSTWFQGFAIVISYLYDPDELFSTNVRRSLRGQFIAGPHRPPTGLTRHMSDVLLEPLQRLAVFDPDPIPRLVLPSGCLCPEQMDLLDWVRRTQPLAVHPGSGSDEKNWPELRWCKFLKRWERSEDSPLLLIGGEAEAERLSRLMGQLSPTRHRLARNLPLPFLGQLLGRCRAFVGHDSGITHLAASVGVPVTALWGRTSAETWRPRHPQTRLIECGSKLAELEVAIVMEKVRAMLSHF